MKIYAVIDTNVIFSALISKNQNAATVRLLDAFFDGLVIPLYHSEMIEEYNEVLHRKKFRLEDQTIQTVLRGLIEFGKEVFPHPTGDILIDMDDLIFYEVAMEKREDNAYLVTGNQKHYPLKDFIVTPSEMMEILQQKPI